MIKHQNYYIEFYKELDKHLEAFALKQEQEDSLRLILDNYNMKEPLILYLFYRLIKEKDYYNNCRLAGMGIDKAMIRVNTFLNSFWKEQQEAEKIAAENISECPWADVLQDYKGQLLVYLFDKRQLEYLTPLIKEIDNQVLLLSEFELPEETNFSDNISVMPITFSNKKEFANRYMEKNFPFLFYYANTFSFLLRFLSPKGIICLEGCHIQEHLLAVMGKAINIPVIGIQQGWPSLTCPHFRRFQYHYFFSWGERFNELWRITNPSPEYLSMGCIYEAERKELKKDCVTFFLHEPFYLSSIDNFNKILDLVSYAASAFPSQEFQVMEHAECKIPPTILKKWGKIHNIKIVTDMTLEEIYERSRIVVSHFSSSLMKAILHGAIPLIYAPTTDLHHYSDVEKERIGLMAGTAEELQNYLSNLIECDTQPSVTKNVQHPEWFTATGNRTLHNMIDFLKERL